MGSERAPGSVEGRSLEDAELIRRARDGDARAYEELVERYREVVFRTAFLVTRSSADAEDAAQDAFVKAYYALPRFREGAPFRPWILRIVANEARNRRRSARRHMELAVRAAADPRAEDAAPSPEAAVLAIEARRDLAAAVDRLPEQHRLAIACRYFLDLSEADTAEVLGCRQGTVKSRLSRALVRLRQELAVTPAREEAASG